MEKQDIFLSNTRALGAQLGLDEAVLTTAYEQLRRGQGDLQGRLRSKYKDDKAVRRDPIMAVDCTVQPRSS